MRDILLTIVFAIAIVWTFKRHYLAPLVWCGLSMFNPHRLTYGFAYDMPFAQITALCMLSIFLFSKSRHAYPRSAPAILMLLFYAWVCITSLASFNTPSEVFEAWLKVTKIQVMLFITLMMLSGRKHIDALICVIVFSIGFYGVKGGVFTLSRGGLAMVIGPPGSFIEGTNHIALAMVMIVPLMFYLSTVVEKRWMRLSLYAIMGLTTLSVLGTTSRGAFLAVGAMALLLALKSRRKVFTLSIVVLVMMVSVAIMSDQWADKMSSITTHEDASAQSRLYTWKMIWNLALHHPLTGGGFQITENPLTWQTYAVTEYAKAYSPHSIYFQALAEHGFPGLFLYLAIGVSTWLLCNSIIRRATTEETQWAASLVKMIQASLIGFAVGGAFVNLVNFDLPYYFVGLVVLTDMALRQEAAKVKAPATLATA